MIQRKAIFLLAGLLSGEIRGGTPGGQDQVSSTKQTPPITFKDDIGPMLKKNCAPCHFEGEKVYAKLPFEKYETVRALGIKLNTRLKGKDADQVSRWIKNEYQKERVVQLKTP